MANWRVRGLLLAAVVALGMTLGACTQAVVEVSEEVLDQAVVTQDVAYEFINTLNTSSSLPEIEKQQKQLDREIARLEQAGGDKEMAAYYEAITAWRAAMDQIGDSDVMANRALQDMDKAMDTATIELDAALDAAGR